MANVKWYTNKHNGELRQFSDAWYKINTGDGKYPNPNWRESNEKEIADWLQEETDPAETVVDTDEDTGNGEQTKVVTLTPAKQGEKPAKATGGKKVSVAEVVPPAPAVETPVTPETPVTLTPVIEAGDGEEAKDGETSK